MTERGEQAPLTPRNADEPQTGMDAGSALKTRPGTEPDGTGTDGNIENAPPTVADRYGAGVDPAKPRHTPGPWESIASDPSEGFECYWVRAAKPYGGPFRGSRIVEIGAVNGPQNSEQSANARLIAAAPDMLDTERRLAAEVGGLRAFEHEIRAAIGNTSWALLMQRLAEADAAIAKATLPTPEPTHD